MKLMGNNTAVITKVFQNWTKTYSRNNQIKSVFLDFPELITERIALAAGTDKWQDEALI